MLRKTKDRRALARVVTADAFEHARSVVNDMRHHVDTRVFPINKLTVFPYFRRDLHCVYIFSGHNLFTAYQAYCCDRSSIELMLNKLLNMVFFLENMSSVSMDDCISRPFRFQQFQLLIKTTDLACLSKKDPGSSKNRDPRCRVVDP